jgi:hypothetical protein
MADARVLGCRSVDVEHGLAADAAFQEGVERWGGVAPGGFELDLAVEPARGHERAEAGEVAGAAGVARELVEEVQRVDPCHLRPVEPRRMERDGFVVILGCDVDDDAARGDVLDRGYGVISSAVPAQYSLHERPSQGN